MWYERLNEAKVEGMDHTLDYKLRDGNLMEVEPPWDLKDLPPGLYVFVFDSETVGRDMYFAEYEGGDTYRYQYCGRIRRESDLW